MQHGRVEAPFYVVKAEELAALSHMPDAYPRPQGLDWIDRGRNTRLQSASVQMLMRTLYRNNVSGSVRRLHESAGLKVIFRSDADRSTFAKMFRAALTAYELSNQGRKSEGASKP